MLVIKELCRKQRLGYLNAFSMPGRPVLHATPMFIDPFFHHSNHPWDATESDLKMPLLVTNPGRAGYIGQEPLR
jgi:hypothetical protein